MSIDQYAVFGNPIAHSKSPLLQQAFAEQTQQSMQYSARKVDDFITAAQEFFAAGGRGLNVTVPFKQDAFEFADELSDRARRAGAVNTLSRLDNHLIHGDNTDGFGLVNDIISLLEWKIKGKSVLILGAGGAVRGILQPIIEEQPHSLLIANRTVAKAESLAHDFSDLFPITACGFSGIPNQTFDLIINATSASLSNDLPPLPGGIIHQATACYDMMYAKHPTPFLQWAKEHGTNFLSDGLGMLVGQGAESFYRWRGLRPKILPVIDLLRSSL